MPQLTKDRLLDTEHVRYLERWEPDYEVQYRLDQSADSPSPRGAPQGVAPTVEEH